MNWFKTFFRGWVMLLLFFIPALAAACRLLWMICSGDMEGGKRALRGVDMAINACALRGNPFETVSSNCGRNPTAWWARVVIWITDRIEAGHCAGAAVQEAPLLKLIAEHREKERL